MRTCARIVALAAAVAPVAAGCTRGDRSPDCKAVGDAYASLQRKEIEKPYAGPPSSGSPSGTAGTPQEQKAQALSLIPLLKEAMVKQCTDKKWNGETRRCIVAARTPDDLERCRTREEDEVNPPPTDQSGKAGQTERPGTSP